MSRRPNVFIKKNCFIVLDGLIGGRITGEKQDTITVFYKGGDSYYFHIGSDAREVFDELVDELQSIRIFDSVPITNNPTTPNGNKGLFGFGKGGNS